MSTGFLPRDDRRESKRVALEAIRLDTGEFPLVGHGDLGVGGLLWRGRGGPLSQGEVALAFEVPGADAVLHVKGEVLEQRRDGAEALVRVRFRDVELSAERAIARFLDAVCPEG